MTDAPGPRRAPTNLPFRRADDIRFSEIKADLTEIRARLDEIRVMVISEPEASPLGRYLKQRAETNHNDIVGLDRRIDGLEDWRAEWRGGGRLVAMAGAILGVIGTFFALLSYFGWHA